MVRETEVVRERETGVVREIRGEADGDIVITDKECKI
jgi:hypothetical protein